MLHAPYLFPVPDYQGLAGRRVFPPDDPWNTDISNYPVDPDSPALIASIGAQTSLHPDFGTVYRDAPVGIPFAMVSGDQPRVPITFKVAAESDPGPYPIPPDAPIEGGAAGTGDRHVIVIDKSNWVLYELFAAFPEEGGRRWRAFSGAIFDMKKPSVQRPFGWTSADAAGLPIFAGLVRYDEVVKAGHIPHALRFTVRRSRQALVYPATHFASESADPALPPMGMRVRLKRDYDISGFPRSVQVILRCLKTYGMVLSDNGKDWFISGVPDPRWNDRELYTLTKVTGSALEVVHMGQIVTRLPPAP